MKLPRAHRTPRGQAIILVALMAMLLFGLAAFALDLSLAMSDRRMLQANVDAAALAGAVAYPTSTNAAHWVALQYLQKPLNFTLPVGSCTSVSACPAGTYTTGTYTITIGDPATKTMDLSLQHTQPGLFAGMIGQTVKTGNSVRTTAPGPTVIPASYGAVTTSGDLGVNGGGGSTRNFGNSVYAFGSFGANNSPHADGIPFNATDYNGATCSPTATVRLDNGGASNSLWFAWIGGTGPQNYNQPVPTPFDSYAPVPPVGTYTTTAMAQDGSGNWKPGTYNGVYPSGGKMNPGVYKIINVTSAMSLGSITNLTYTSPGTEDAAGAVAIVLDSSDTGSLDISSAQLNGLDDLHPQSYTGPRDPQGTHNFVFFGGNGASAYSGTISFAPGSNPFISGIFYMPKVTVSSSGNASFNFTGQFTAASVSVSGGGNGTQTIQWVCNLAVVLGNPAFQGGINR
jgi:Flp pilus assembly protein TadG